MANEETRELKKQADSGDIERTSTRRTFIPNTDIIEQEDTLLVLMDIPGAVEDNIEVNLEDNILTVTAKIDAETYDGYRPLYQEYQVGDFQRSFRLIEDFDSDKIEATLKQGVLTLTLPRSEKAKPRKIQIKSE